MRDAEEGTRRPGEPTWLDERSAAIKRRFEVPVLVAAILVIPVVFLEQSPNPTVVGAALVMDWLIWAVFTVEFLVMLAVVPDRRLYVHKAWLDLAIVVLSFPLFRTLSWVRAARIARLGPALRVLRLFRVAAIVTRGGVAARAVFKSHGVGYLTIVTLLVCLGGGALIALIEPDVANVIDGIWWAIVTVTTVGYGDISPATTSGRATAIVLMVLGIGLTALLTAAITARFVSDEDERLMAIETRLRAIEEAVTDQGDRGA